MKTLKKSLLAIAGLTLVSTGVLADAAKSQTNSEKATTFDLNRICAPLAINTPAPGVVWATRLSPWNPIYGAEYFYLDGPLGATISTFTNLVLAVQDASVLQGAGAASTAYSNNLLPYANAFVANCTLGANCRLTLADTAGVVIYDSNATGGCGNSFDCYFSGDIEPNKNTSLSFMDAQMWPCGVGAETGFQTDTNSFETCLTIRMGSHLGSQENNPQFNAGTARICVDTPGLSEVSPPSP